MNRELFRPDIQVLRGIAVLSVVAYHFFPEVFVQGFLGVDAFFVISGYVVTPLIFRIFSHQTKKDNLVALKNFYTRRFFRLAPSMLFTLILATILIVFLASTSDLKIFGQQVIYSILLAGNIGAFRLSGDYFHNNGNPLIHTWSLAVEEQIYIGLPLIILLVSFVSLSRFKEKTRTILILLTCISLSLYVGVFSSEVVYSNFGIRDTASFEFYSPLERFWEFGAGGLMWLIREKRNRSGRQANSYVSGFLNLALFSTLTFVGTSDQKLGTLIIVACTVLVIHNKACDFLPKVIHGVLSWIGDRSYSIYLIHMPIVFLIERSPYLDFSSSLSQYFFKFFALFSVFVMGHIVFKKVEIRFRISPKTSESLESRRSTIFGIQTAALLALSSLLIVGSNSSYFGLQEPLPNISKPWGMDLNCARMTEWNGPPCIYPAIEPLGTVMLIGDSHAAQFSEVIAEAGRMENWTVVIWTMAGCAVVFEKNTSQISKDCLYHNLETLSWIKENSPELVIVSQYNGSFLPQKDIRDSLIAIDNYAERIHLVGNTPVFSDRRFMAYPALFQAAYKPKSTLPLSEMDLRNTEISTEFLKWGKSLGFSVSDLNYLWCTDTECRRKDDSGWLFFDRDHLSVQGASLALPYFRQLLTG